MPNDCCCVRCKWVFKVKRNGVFRARLVACGYSQIAGVDYQENFAPVITDITWRTLLVLMLTFGYDGKLIDIEVAFLHGDLEEDIYMDCPEGMESAKEDECLQLQHTIYGLVQAARQFWKKLVSILKKIGFEGGQAGPCLMMRKDKKGVIFIGLYVDDCLCIGDATAIEGLASELRSAGLQVKDPEELKDYLSCKIHYDEGKKSAVLIQEDLLRKMNKKFGDMVKNLTTYKMPGTPSVGLTCPEDKSWIIDAGGHATYHSGVGMLLYLAKHTRPDIANAVRELSKLNDCPTEHGFKEMKRVIKYVLDTRNKGLKFKPEQSKDFFNMFAYSDSDFAGDKDKRTSVSGFIIIVNGAPVSWKSKAQASVTLSSSEAEYVALSETAKEIKFIWMLIKSMGFEVKLPITVRVDNIGAIFMSENITASNRTKHVDIRFHFVNEMVEQGFIEVIFIRTNENLADIFTKNVNTELGEAHHKEIIDKAH